TQMRTFTAASAVAELVVLLPPWPPPPLVPPLATNVLVYRPTSNDRLQKTSFCDAMCSVDCPIGTHCGAAVAVGAESMLRLPTSAVALADGVPEPLIGSACENAIIAPIGTATINNVCNVTLAFLGACPFNISFPPKSAFPRG